MSVVEISFSFHPLVCFVLTHRGILLVCRCEGCPLNKIPKIFGSLCDSVFYFSNKNPTLSVTHQNTVLFFFFFLKGYTFAEATLLFLSQNTN